MYILVSLLGSIFLKDNLLGVKQDGNNPKELIEKGIETILSIKVRQKCPNIPNKLLIPTIKYIPNK